MLRKLPSIALPASAAVIVACLVTLTRADPDLWGHVLFGTDILRAGGIAGADPYSFTADRTWINHEWLAEVIMAAAYAAAGAAGLVLLKVAAIAASLWCVCLVTRRDGATPRAAAILAVFTLAGVMSRTQAVRPQLFSVICFAALLLILRRAEARIALLWLAVPLLAFWANVHGGWVVGCATLAIWSAAQSVTFRPLAARRLVTTWGASAAATAATLATPYGLELWGFLYETVGTSRRFISEWGWIFEQPYLLATWIGCWALVFVAMRFGGRRSSWPSIAVTLGWGIASFKVSRLDAFFALSAVMLLAPDLVSVLNRRGARSAPAPSRVRNAALAVVALVTCVVGLPQLARNLTCIDVHASGSPEPAAMALMKQQRFAGRMVTYFDWGEYAIWHAPRSLRISMDGRRETVYSDGHVDRHLDLYLATPGGLTYLEQLEADYVWIPAELPLAANLAASLSWSTAFRGDRSVIFARRGLSRGSPIGGVGNYCRCFPGP